MVRVNSSYIHDYFIYKTNFTLFPKSSLVINAYFVMLNAFYDINSKNNRSDYFTGR